MDVAKPGTPGIQIRYDPQEQENARLLLAKHLDTDRLAFFPRLYRRFFRRKAEKCLLPEVVQASYCFSVQSFMHAFGSKEFLHLPLCEVRSDVGLPQLQVERNRIAFPENLSLHSLHAVPLSMAEELGHHFRCRYTSTIGEPHADTHNTHEFFGTVGKMIVLRDLGERNAEQWHLPSSDFPGSQAWSNARIVDQLREIRGELRECTKKMKEIRRGRKTAYRICDAVEGKGPDASLFLAGKEKKQWDHLADRHQFLVWNRKSLLQHARGYRFGGQIELQKIINLKTFFSLPETEVRRRFFRENPDFSGLEKVEDIPKF